MAYKLIQNLTKVNYTKGNNGRRYIVIHYTGNRTDTAMANSNYFKNTNRSASAHYFVDAENVVQVVSDSDTAWAVGRNYGSNNLFGRCTNGNSISIEMCSTDGKISDGTYRNTVELTKTLMKKYNIDAAYVVRHWDVCSKSCPGWTGWGANGCNSSIWNQFRKDIVSGTVGTIPAPTPTPAPIPTPTPSVDPSIVFKYMVRAGGRWYPEVRNLGDYAGVRGKAITDVAIGVTQGSVKYRVHVKGGGWLPYVTGYNTSDGNNGYAGNGREIDAIEVYYNTPSTYANNYGYKKAKYRVAVIGRDYYSWQYDNEKGNGMDGYAGAFGRSMDRFQICPN